MLGSRLARHSILSFIAVLIVLSLFTAQAERIAETIYLLAVSDSGEGIVVKTRVYLGGSGLRILPEALEASDTRLSIRLAWLYSSLLTGKSVGAVVVFPKPNVKGASAGAVFALVFTAADNGVLVDSAITGTGMLSPLGLILPVYGVKAKLEAAEEQGFRKVFVPFESNISVKGIGIVRACSVLDVLSALSLGVVPQPQLSLPSTTVSRLFMDDARLLIGLAERLGLNTSLAERLYSMGHYYSAASIAFSRLASKQSKAIVESVLRLLGANGLQEALQLMVKKVSSIRAEVLRETSIPVDKLLALVEVEYRLYLAERLASNTSAKPFSALRLLTVESWLDVFNNVSGPEVPSQIVRNAARLLVNYADTSYKYLLAVTGFKPSRILMEDGRSIKDWVADAKMFLILGNYVRAIALALRVIEQTDTILTLGTMKPSNAYKCYWRILTWYTGMVSRLGLPLDVLMVFAEYARDLDDKVAASMVLAHAVALSMLLLTLSNQNMYAGLTTTTPVAQASITLAAIFSAAAAATAALAPFALRFKEV